ncbi:MAG: membrane protein insertion efficiency factor YidD [Hominimerdicola sp.]
MKHLAILLIEFYRKFISPLFPARCKYYPSCSAYALQAFKKHGFFKGFILSGWRILRCNPFSEGGVDYVPEKFEWDYFRKREK